MQAESSYREADCVIEEEDASSVLDSDLRICVSLLNSLWA
jgi:hypothetical protein